MLCTSDDIRREHDAALAALNSAQRRAIDRLARARRLSTFNHRTAGENLTVLFEAEAAERAERLNAAA